MPQSVIRGTLTLTAASLATRLMGLAYRVYLVRLAGPQVIGLFQMIFPLYFTLMVLSSAGIPLAVSKMVADRDAMGREDSIRRVMKASILLTLGAGIIVTAILFMTAGVLSYRVLKDGRTLLPLLVIAPGLPAIGLAGTLKGYFQGRSRMGPVGTSQILEQLVHIVITIGLLMAYSMEKEGITAALLAAGSLAGDLAGTTFISLYYRADTKRRWKDPAKLPNRKGHGREGTRAILRELLGLAIPITAGRLVISVNSAINATLIPNLLRGGGSTLREATASFGELTGMAMNLLTIPTVFTASMAISIVPGVAGAQTTGDDRTIARNAWQALKSAIILGIFFSSLFVALGEQMCSILFNSASAGVLLAVLAPGGVALYCQHVLSGVLQGLRKPAIPMFCSLVATAMSTLGLIVFVHYMGLGIRGAAMSISVAMCMGALMSLAFVLKNIPLPGLGRTFGLVLLCGTISGSASRGVASLMGTGSLSLIAGCLTGFLAFLGSILGLRVVSISFIPRLVGYFRNR